MSPVFLCHARFCLTSRAEVGLVNFWDFIFVSKKLIDMPSNRYRTERGWERKREGQKKGREGGKKIEAVDQDSFSEVDEVEDDVKDKAELVDSHGKKHTEVPRGEDTGFIHARILLNEVKAHLNKNGDSHGKSSQARHRQSHDPSLRREGRDSRGDINRRHRSEVPRKAKQRQTGQALSQGPMMVCPDTVNI